MGEQALEISNAQVLGHAAFLQANPMNKLDRYQPYPWQIDFHNAGSEYPERMLMAANRVGKTVSAAAETTYHLTGEYPAWWEGKRFDGGVLVWAGSVTNEASRDIVQRTMFGGMGQELGTGLVPKDKIIGKPQTRQAGISGVMDMVKIEHASGGISTVVFKSYDSGWRKWQGTAPDVVWLDEEPDESTANEKRIYSEAQTRILSSQGRLLVTFTPLLGETTLVRHFNEGLPGCHLVTATWDDAPHLDPKQKEQLEASYPDHEREARTRGVPMMGEGRVFAVAEEDLKTDPFEIPNHWFRVCGIDFGIDHPAAAAWWTFDRDNDVWYIYDCYRMRGQTSVYHADAIKRRGEYIPVAWPHDGLNREKSGGKTLKDSYAEHGVNMLPISARYDRDKGGGQPQEPIIYDLLERMKTGRLKVFSTCSEWFDEFRSYHRKDGKLVAARDDVLKASFYGAMMQAYATQRVIKSTRDYPGLQVA